MHAISSYRGNRHTNPHTNKQTHRQDRLQYIAPLSLARSVKIAISDQGIGRLLLRVQICVVAFLVDADVVGVKEQAVFLSPDGELAVVLVDAQPADGLDPVAQAAQVAAAGRLVRQRSLVAAEFERVLRRLGAASTHGQ